MKSELNNKSFFPERQKPTDTTDFWYDVVKFLAEKASLCEN